MDMQKMKLGAAAIAGAVVIAGASYAFATWMTTPELVAVSSAGCGSAGTAANFGLPLRTVGTAAPAIGVSFGPVDYPSAGGAVRLAFDRQVDGKGREITQVGDTLRLPVVFGRESLSPERIRINCRDGMINTIRYDRGRSGTTFNVVRQEVSEAIDEPQPQTAS